jgi:hypothetical protein
VTDREQTLRLRWPLTAGSLQAVQRPQIVGVRGIKWMLRLDGEAADLAAASYLEHEPRAVKADHAVVETHVVIWA